MDVIITIIYAILIISILHYCIKFILLKEKIYRYKKNIKENFNTQKNDDNTDIKKMEDELLTYLNSEKDFYQNAQSPQPNGSKISNNHNVKCKDNIEINALDKYFEKKVNIEKEIKNEEINKKEKIKNSSDTVPNIIMKENNDANSFENSWTYKDENIMNGGEIGKNLLAWDNSDSYAIYDNPFN